MMNTPTLSKEQTATAVIEKSRPLSENRVLLYGVSWETFERLLADVGDRRTTLFHYINGTLEIMSPLSLHEGSNRFIEALLPWNEYLSPSLSQKYLRANKCQLFAIKFKRISIYA